METKRKIIIVDGELPQFVGEWKVGEVLRIAQQLAAWVESLSVNTEPKPAPPNE